MTSFAAIDLLFARHLLPQAEEAHTFFLATLMALSRNGHLSLYVDQERIWPSLECIEEDPEKRQQLEKRVLEGAKTLPPDLKWIKREGNCWYLERNWKCETKFLSHLKRLSQAETVHPIALPEKMEKLQPEQQQALQKACQSTFSLISGGPGSGKSYVATILVSQALQKAPDDYRIVLAAPTGKAASHLESKTIKDKRIRCATLHLLLNIRDRADLNREKGYLGADLLIVDECSMIDMPLFAYLLASLESGTRVILMGDEHQLPPIDVGTPFVDLLSFPWIPATRLSKSMRSDSLEILQAAEAIKNGNIPEIEIEDRDTLDLASYFLSSSFEEMQSRDRFCILSCMRQGPWGVDHLNQSILSQLLSKAKKGETFFAPIMITKNDYSQKLYNGQTGTLVRRVGFEEEDKIVITGREFSAYSISHFTYAYVLSVHKSQGSEYDHLLLLVPPGSEVFGRELLYTAVTRARHTLKIIGKREVFIETLKRSVKSERGPLSRDPLKEF